MFALIAGTIAPLEIDPSDACLMVGARVRRLEVGDRVLAHPAVVVEQHRRARGRPAGGRRRAGAATATAAGGAERTQRGQGDAHLGGAVQQLAAAHGARGRKGTVGEVVHDAPRSGGCNDPTGGGPRTLTSHPWQDARALTNPGTARGRRCPRASRGSTTSGSRWPTAPGWRRGSGCPRMPNQQPVPALLEAIPYRKNDATSVADAGRHGYFAQHGYASVRVDIRGSGDSDGILLDEYLQQEQDDLVEVIAWIAAQPWCNGTRRHVRILVGRVRGAAGRGPPSARAEGDRQRGLDRRPLRRRRPLHGRLPARLLPAVVGDDDARLFGAAARPGHRRRRLARCLAGSAWRARAR